MVRGRHPLVERMTLNWHDHWATSNDKVGDVKLMMRQQRTLRRYALGNFRTLARALVRDGAMQINRTGRIGDITDGASNTLLVAERTGGNVIYLKGGRVAGAPWNLFGPSNGGGWGDLINGEQWLEGSLYDGTLGPNGGPCGINCTNLAGGSFYSFHAGGCHFVMCDGSVRFIAEGISQFTLAALITRQKGEIVGDF
jgi:prepilin-type processing-associated H-X9-DG protein